MINQLKRGFALCVIVPTDAQCPISSIPRPLPTGRQTRKKAQPSRGRGCPSQTRPSSVRACPTSPQLLRYPPEGPNTVWDLGRRRPWTTQCEERAASYRKSQAKHSIEISRERRPARHSHGGASRWVSRPATSHGLKTTGSAYEKTQI